MKKAGVVAVLFLAFASQPSDAREQTPSRPMTKEEGRKVNLYAINECKQFPTGTSEQVLCMQAVFIRVGKLWNTGQTPSFLK
jgi:hypothetical protein